MPTEPHQPAPPAPDHVCLYSSYFTQSRLPYFVRAYLEQLLPHFGRIIFLTNDDRELDQESLQWLSAREIELMPVRNEGYDFGMWQKAILQHVELADCRRLCLANDSCLCFAPLNEFMDWATQGEIEAAGMVRSLEGGEHLQSYLLTLSGRAIPVALRHIAEMNFSQTDYYHIVAAGELGLSRALLAAGIPLQARYWSSNGEEGNPSFLHSTYLIEAGMPLLKRKLLINPKRHVMRQAIRSRQGISRSYYRSLLIARHPGNSAAIQEMFAELPAISLRLRIRTWRQLIRLWLGIRLGWPQD